MYSHLGKRIKKSRELARSGEGISQAELADLVGINQAALSQIEAGKTIPRRPTLIALSFILNDDFGEPWLEKFFRNSKEEKTKEFNFDILNSILVEANGLSKKSFYEMQSIWEMLRAEINRRKNIEE